MITNEQKETLDVYFKYRYFITDQRLVEMGQNIATLETQDGVLFELTWPLVEGRFKDMLVGEKVGIFYNYQKFIIEHKRNSGISEKRIEEMFESNRKNLIQFAKKNEENIS